MNDTELPSADQLSAWQLPAKEIDRLLATSDDPRLRLLFGADYEALRQLARKATGAVRGKGPTVLLVPGILGSTLGKPGNFITRNTIWFDPVSLALGEIVQLKLPANGASKIEALDVVPTVHAFLRLRLKTLGYEVEYYPYDWRQSIVKLGQQLAAFIAKHKASEILLVAHSMGGLVSRAALAAGAAKVKRLVMLGTPNRGSFSPVEVLQGINGNVQTVDQIDIQKGHDATFLVKEVFSTFPSVYEMLPRPDVFKTVNLFSAADWPTVPFRPAANRLTDAQAAWGKFADADPRMFLIAGFGQDTVTGLAVDGAGRFVYSKTNQGDGTVPLMMCEQPGVDTRYVSATHTGLLRSEDVALAVDQLLRTGKTHWLGDRPATTRTREAVTLTADDFVLTAANSPFGARRGTAISGDEMAAITESLVSFSSLPASETLPTIQAAANISTTQAGSSAARLTSDFKFQQTVISRDLHTQLELELCNVNVFDVPYRAVVLGIFENVDPGGPAIQLDRETEGTVSELLKRRMFTPELGRVFVMPTGRHALRADFVVFVGMGSFDAFNAHPENALRTMASSVLQTLIRCGVDEFATVIYGGASGQPLRATIENLMAGYLEALHRIREAGVAMNFRRIAICECNAERYAELKDEAYRIGGSDMCREIRLRLHEPAYRSSPAVTVAVPAPAPVQPVLAAGATPEAARAAAKELAEDCCAPGSRPDMSYLTVRILEDPSPKSTLWTVHVSLLTSGGKASVFPSAKQIDRVHLDELLSELSSLTFAKIPTLGRKLRQLLLTEDFCSLLDHGALQETHLAVIHDGLASRIPWELIPLQHGPNGIELPAIDCGLSRRYQTDGTNSIARYLEERQRAAKLRILLIVNPTEDLDGAAREGERILNLFKSESAVEVVVLNESEATRTRVLKELQSGRYDVVHYAGHAFFDPENRNRSGLICAGEEVLTGRDIASLESLPTLMFFNACESGRIRSRFPGSSRSRRPPEIPKHSPDRAETNIGVAEALLRGGIAQFVGTYWPVGDSAAEHFASAFYTSLLHGDPVRCAVLKGRKAVHKKKNIDFADYMHFGNPGQGVKAR